MNTELIETLNALIQEMEELKLEIVELRKVNKDISEKLYNINERLTTMD